MKIVFLGATKFSYEMLQTLIKNKISVEAVFSIPQNFELKKRGEASSQKYANSYYSDLQSLSESAGIPYFEVSGGDQTLSSYKDRIAAIKPDLILVLGWYYIVPKSIRDLAQIGTFGIHASLLPAYAGGSPLVWALIHGETKTGITLFKIEDGIDDGDILAQREIDIALDDTIKSLYEKVIHFSKTMLVEELDHISRGTHQLIKQDKSLIKPFPIRTEKDGLINWNQKARNIYNFVRAQTKPYPCAFSYFGSEKVKFISMALDSEIEGTVYSMMNLTEDHCGEIIFHEGDPYICVQGCVIKPLDVEVAEKTMTFSEFLNNTPIKVKKFNNEH